LLVGLDDDVARDALTPHYRERSDPDTDTFAIMAARLMALVAITALLNGCVESSEQEIQGVWLLESFNVDGADASVEIGVNTARQPWVEIGTDLFGNAGCNDFSESRDDPHSYENGTLVIGEIFNNMAFCGELDGTLMMVEEVFSKVMAQGQSGIRVSTTGDQMTWNAGGTSLSFVREAD
jgi:hypothetical protein